VISACNRLGSAAKRGPFGTGVVEFEHGMLLVTEITSDSLLAMLFRPNTNIGSLLFELQRHRSAIAGLL
jgi:predicted regulator of Ras-like GTPase activity (Roadblock/LC7/MglB family)